MLSWQYRDNNPPEENLTKREQQPTYSLKYLKSHLDYLYSLAEIFLILDRRQIGRAVC